MKKKEAVRNFVRANYSFLMQKQNFDKKKYNQLKKTYFGELLQYKFSLPRDKEICTSLVKLLVRSQRICDKELIEQTISETSFLRVNNIKADDYIALIDLTGKKYAMKETTQGFSELEKQEKLLEHLKREHSKEIEERIEKKEEEYRRLPSILDDTDISEPEGLPKEEETKDWWEELRLREDPFPSSLDGFFGINKSLYDEIIIETPPIQWALNKIRKEQIDIFHRGFLLGGEFGTGKTTFFDFMAPHLAVKHVEPIRIALSENISEAHYMQNFQKEICMKIANIVKKYNLSATSRIIDFEEARFQMLEIQNRGAKGFFIFIDDLHKNIDLNRVFNFLANLQITKNVFSRDGINVVFVVSGLPSWKDRIRRDTALTGFFDAFDELTLPEVTPQLAAQAIKKRLKAFAANPGKEMSVKEEFLETIFKRTSAEIGRANIGFRPYIQEAVKHFKKREFDILSVDFTKLDESTTKELRHTLEADNHFKRSIDKLLYGGGIKRKEVREMTLKVLCEIYLRNGVSEDEDVFYENKFSFKQLSKCGLIQKYDRKGKLVWKLSPFLEQLNKEVIAKFNLSIEDYLVPVYSTPTQRLGEKRIEQNRVKEYERDLKSWKGQLEPPIISGVTTALRMYSEYIFPLAEAKGKKQLSSLCKGANIAKIQECIWTMMKSIIKFESPRLFDIFEESNILGWTLRYRTLEFSQYFISMTQDFQKEKIEETDVARLISFADDAFGELWSEFKESVSMYQSCGVKCSDIPKKTLKTIYSEHSNVLSMTRPKEEYFDSLSKLVRNIEETIRRYLLVGCSLILGPYHERIKYYPEDIKRYITKNIPSSSTSYESYNEFEHLNRGQYRFLFTQIAKDSVLYRFIIRPLIKGWDSRDINAFFDLFGDLNIIAGHIKTISAEERKKDVPTFFRLACRMMSDISKRLRSFVIFNSTILSSNDKTFVVFGYNYERNKKVERKVEIEEATNVPSAIYRHEITGVLRTNGINKIMDNSDNVFGTIELDLLDIEETAIKFNMRYCESIALIASLVADNRVRVVPLYGTNICLVNDLSLP